METDTRATAPVADDGTTADGPTPWLMAEFRRLRDAARAEIRADGPAEANRAWVAFARQHGLTPG